MPVKKSIALGIAILIILLYSYNLSYASSNIGIEEVAGSWTGKVEIKVNSIIAPSEKIKQQMIDSFKEIEAKEQSFDLEVKPGNKLYFHFTDYFNQLDYFPDGRISGQHHKTINGTDSTYDTDSDISGQVTGTNDGFTLKMDIEINSITKIDFGEGLKVIRFNGIYTYTMNKKESGQENAPAGEKGAEGSNAESNSQTENNIGTERNEQNNPGAGTGAAGIILKEIAEKLKDVNNNTSSVLPILSSVNAVKMTNLDRKAFHHFMSFIMVIWRK